MTRSLLLIGLLTIPVAGPVFGQIEPRIGPERQLTDGPRDDEDGAFFLGEDGTVYFAFISNRSGNMDVWLTSSQDGLQWSPPRAIIATPHDDLLNNATRTSDGLYHLTGRTQYMVGDSTSSDLQAWSAPKAWTDPRKLKWTAGYFQEGANGDYWLVSLSDRSGTHKLYMQKSADRGNSWSDPLPLTHHDQADYIFAFRIVSDGTLLLVWEQRDSKDSRKLASTSSNVYCATSRDGVEWSPPTLLSPDTGKQDFDLWPSLLLGPGDVYYATWLTSRIGTQTAPGVVMVPVYPKLNVDEMRVVPAQGYSVRSQRMPDGRYLLAYVKTNPTNKSKDYYYRTVQDFDFDQVPPEALGKTR